jgi:glycosyltransferase involved in cell wall biosynthesis
MRVLVATPLFPPEIASALLEELPKRQIAIDLVRFADVRYLPKLMRHYAFYRNVLKAGKEADTIYALDPVSVGLPALKAAQKLGKPFVVKIVGDYAWEQGRQRFGVRASLDAFIKKPAFFPVNILRRIQTQVAYSADKVVVPSDYLKYIVSCWGVPEAKIEVIYNAVPLQMPETLPEAVGGLPRPLIISVGRLVPWKGFLGLIDAVATLRQGGIKASLAIIGSGPLEGEIKNYARQELGTRGVLFTGSLPHGQVLSALKNADAFVLNSSYEGLSHVLIEALALGAPIIATRVGGNGEVIADGVNGILISTGDSDELARALKRILEDKALSSRLSSEAKKSVGKFTETIMADKTAAVLHSVI